jgi:dihydrodipicolinate synthase/N-acetylneuraminate lyase
MKKISGVYCASITPINNSFSVNKDLFLHHNQSLSRKGLEGLVLFGTNVEASRFIKSILFCCR